MEFGAGFEEKVLERLDRIAAALERGNEIIAPPALTKSGELAPSKSPDTAERLTHKTLRGPERKPPR